MRQWPGKLHQKIERRQEYWDRLNAELAVQMAYWNQHKIDYPGTPPLTPYDLTAPATIKLPMITPLRNYVKRVY